MFSASSPTGPAFEGAQIVHGMHAASGAIERVRIDPVTREPRFRVIGEDRWSDEWDMSPDASPEEQPRHLAAGICGSGIIEAVVELYLAGVLLANGRFNPNITSSRMRWDGPSGSYELATAIQTTTDQPLIITQRDVRNIQLAKAALYAGAIHIPHASDEFSHIAELLPQQPDLSNSGSSRRSQRAVLNRHKPVGGKLD